MKKRFVYSWWKTFLFPARLTLRENIIGVLNLAKCHLFHVVAFSLPASLAGKIQGYYPGPSFAGKSRVASVLLPCPS